MSLPRVLTEWLAEYEADVVSVKGNQYIVQMADPSRWPGNGNLEYLTTDAPCISVVLKGWKARPYAGPKPGTPEWMALADLAVLEHGAALTDKQVQEAKQRLDDMAAGQSRLRVVA